LSWGVQLAKTKREHRGPLAAPTGYGLHIPDEIERRLRRCRSSIRQAIRTRLQTIAAAETAKRAGHRRKAQLSGPPLRFYSSESYRVSYEIDRHRRKVVVLDLRKELA
jgi:mRNA-degrading endonuclease RelE of RelBE toxin-antitoxin system